MTDETETLKAQRLWLWSLLDDIDTASDAFKDNYEGFARHVYNIASLRHALISQNDGYTLTFNSSAPAISYTPPGFMRFNSTPETNL